MQLEIFQVDAFTNRIFSGNQASIILLPKWIPAEKMLQIADENNQAETAFVVKLSESEYEIRWFTPTTEVDLCGHATLAAAYVLHYEKEVDLTTIIFRTLKHGDLVVKKTGDMFTLNFPTDKYCKVPIGDDIVDCFNIKPMEAYKGKTDYMFVYANLPEINVLVPDLVEISKLHCRGVIVTAKGEDVDFVSRFFAPQSGINEDSVTGSAHTTLTPYWSERLGKTTMSAKQVSTRHGYLECTLLGDRVEISGMARLYLKGIVFVDE